MPEPEVPRVRIVVPCYNEEDRFDAAAFDGYLGVARDVGFLLVNDGSTDGTLTLLEELAARWPGRVEVLDQPANLGKAEAVRAGMVRAMDAGARYVGYFDADLATPLEAIGAFIDVLDRDPRIDIVIGSRIALLGRHIERSAVRHYLGRVFATAASVVLDLPVYDTQCGAKLLRSTPVVRRLFERPFGSRWIFDVELFARYLADQGSPEGLYELALQQWTDVGESKLEKSDFLRAAGEMAALYRTYRLEEHTRAALDFICTRFGVRPPRASRRGRRRDPTR